MNDSAMPDVVFTIWGVGLFVTLVVLVPVAVYLLYATYRAARSIQLYAREALVAAQGIAGHTKNIPALNDTIGVATQILAGATSVDSKLDTIANVFAQRAAR